MIAILFLIAVVFLLALLFARLAETPGEVTLQFLDMQYSTPLIAAVAGLIAIIAAVMLTWWVLKGLVKAPGAIADQQRGRKRDKGYRALSQGMLALGAGDVSQAKALARQADRKLGHTREPMVLLLEAQTALAEDDHAQARGLFDEMLEDQETRPLGLRGLFLEAQREGEHEAARHYAERAAALSPHHLWATEATLEYATLDSDYDKGLGIVEDQLRSKSVSKEDAQRKKAVLLTAKALVEVEANPSAARDLARQAHKIDPALVPASVVEARAHVRLDELRKAAKVLEETWRQEPHPEIADAYVHLRPGDSTADRLKRAKELEGIKPGHVESLLATAHAALDAHDYDLARTKAEAALKEDPREGVFLLLADIEEAQTGDAARVRHWLQSALRAPRDPAWVADGYVADSWAPVSPVTGRFDAFEWRRPTRELGGNALDVDEALAALPGAGDAARSTAPTVDAEDAEIIEINAREADRKANDTDRGRMVAMDGSGDAPGRATDKSPVEVVTGSSRSNVGRSRQDTGSAAASGGQGSAGQDGPRSYAADGTTGSPTRDSASNSDGAARNAAARSGSTSGRGQDGTMQTPDREVVAAVRQDNADAVREARTASAPSGSTATSSTPLPGASASASGAGRMPTGSRPLRGVDLKERTATASGVSRGQSGDANRSPAAGSGANGASGSSQASSAGGSTGPTSQAGHGANSTSDAAQSAPANDSRPSSAGGDTNPQRTARSTGDAGIKGGPDDPNVKRFRLL